MARPVMFYSVQRYGTGGTHDGMAVFDRMWVVYPGFRRTLARQAGQGVCPSGYDFGWRFAGVLEARP